MRTLLRAYRDGDESALERLMIFTYKELFLIAYSYLKDKMLAEDAVSETFVSLIKKIHTVRNETNLIGYLRTIVINHSLDILRKRKREIFPGEEVIEDVPVDCGDSRYVKYVLEKMDGSEREVLLLWHNEFTLHEISQKTDLTVNQVRLRLKRAKESFIKHYHKFSADETLFHSDGGGIK